MIICWRKQTQNSCWADNKHLTSRLLAYLTNYLIRLSSCGADSLFCVYVSMARRSLLANQKHPHRNLFSEVFCFLWLSLKPVNNIKKRNFFINLCRHLMLHFTLTFGAGTCDDFPSLFKCAWDGMLVELLPPPRLSERPLIWSDSAAFSKAANWSCEMFTSPRYM